MPVSLASIKAQTKALPPLEFEDGASLNLRYRVHAFTPNAEAALKESETAGSVSESLVQSLLLLLESWDLTDAKGKVLPLTEATLRDLPISLMGRMFNAISEDQLPPPEKSGSSFD